MHFILENLTTTSPHGSKLVKSSDGTLVTELASVQRLYTPEECARRYVASFGDEQPPMGRSAFLDVLGHVTSGQHCALGALDSTAEHFGRDAFRDAAKLLELVKQRVPTLAAAVDAALEHAVWVEAFLKGDVKDHLVVSSSCSSHNPAHLLCDPVGKDDARAKQPPAGTLRCPACDRVEVFHQELLHLAAAVEDAAPRTGAGAGDGFYGDVKNVVHDVVERGASTGGSSVLQLQRGMFRDDFRISRSCNRLRVEGNRLVQKSAKSSGN